jgi:DNA-binding beta-propeller fold protein YncE
MPSHTKINAIFITLILSLGLGIHPIRSSITYAAPSIIKTISISNPKSIAVNPANNRIYVLNSVNSVATLTVIDGGTSTVIQSTPINNGLHDPTQITVNPTNNRVYISDYESGYVTVIDGTTLQILKEVFTRASGPKFFSVTEGNVYVSLGPNPGTGLSGWAFIGSDYQASVHSPQDIADTSIDAFAVSGSYKFYVGLDCCPSGPLVRVFDSHDNWIADYSVSEPHGIAVNNATRKAYVSNPNTIQVVDDTTQTVVKEISGRGYIHTTINLANNHYYGLRSNNLDIMNGDTLAVLSTVPVGTSPYALAVNSTTNRIYVMDANNLYIVQESGGTPPPTETPTPPPYTGVEPLIFIPGIMGSKLVDDHNVEHWLALSDFTDRGKRSLLLPSTLKLHATYPVNQAYDNLLSKLRDPLGGNYRESGNQLQTPLQRCQDSTVSTTLYVFAYDWRQDIANNQLGVGPTVQLKQLVDCIREKHPGTKVNILTHSLGGLVARRYILNHNTTSDPHYVHKLITIAAPWLGAPQGLNTLLTGDALQGNLLAALGTKLSNADIMELAATFPGGWELLPSQSYFDLGGLPPLSEDNRPFAPGIPYDYNSLRQWLDARYPNVTQFPPNGGAGNVNHLFHTQNLAQDKWQPDNTEVSYFHIYGIGKDEDTVYALRNGYHPACVRIFGKLVCKGPIVWGVYINRWGSGDQTVPVLSAERTQAYNAPATKLKVWMVQGRRQNNGLSDGNTEHSQLTMNPMVQTCILFALNRTSETCDLQEPTLQTATTTTQHAQRASNASSAYYVNVRGESDITVSDAYGNSTNTTTGTLTTPVPNIAIHRLPTGQYLVLPDDQTYTVSFKTSTTPLFIEIRHGTGSSTSQAVRYLDLSLPANVNARIKVSPQGIENLRYDDGSETYPNVIGPTASVSGNQANNTDPPSETVNVTGLLDARKITINATALGTSNTLNAIWYSLDGINYQQYTQPIQVNAIQNPTLYTFADDVVGNRSSLLIYPLVHRITLPLVTR